MSESLSAIPSGVRYYFGSEAHLRRTIEQTAMGTFNGWSYEEIAPPTVDYYSLFERGMGAVEAQRAFRFTDTDGRLLGLRPDVTSGIARAASTLMAKRPRPLRFCYAAQVFRLSAESKAEWRRESSQIGCELIGAGGPIADMEVMAIAAEILGRLGLDGNYTITINDLGVFKGIAESLGFNESARQEFQRLVDTHSRDDLQRFLAPFASKEECESFAELVQLSGKGELFESARRVITNRRSVSALNRLQDLWRLIEDLDESAHFEIDLADVSRLDYYTGLVFKIYVAGVGMRVGSGGRYDGLTANFGKPEPAVGFVLDVDSLSEATRANNSQSGFLPAAAPAASVIAHDDAASLFRSAIKKRKDGERILIGLNEE